MHPIWLSDLLRAENDQVAGLLKQPDKQKFVIGRTRCSPTRGGSDGMNDRRKSVVQFAVRGLDSSTT